MRGVFDRPVKERMPVVGRKITETIAALAEISPFFQDLLVPSRAGPPELCYVAIIDIAHGADVGAGEQIAVVVNVKIIVGLGADVPAHSVVKEKRFGAGVSEVVGNPDFQQWQAGGNIQGLGFAEGGVNTGLQLAEALFADVECFSLAACRPVIDKDRLSTNWLKIYVTDVLET